MNPYEELPARAFWKSAVAEKSPFEIDALWNPRYNIGKSDLISTAGSCFAQHIGRAMVAKGYAWYDAQPSPAIFSAELKRKYNYGVFTFRTGNIYTARALRQWVEWAFGQEPVPDELWKSEGRWIDPFRPAIEPGGFETREELLASRDSVLSAVRRSIENSQVFVFTLGLTESWLNRASGYTYAVCPGTAGGEFRADEHQFNNLDYKDVVRDLRAVVELCRAMNPSLKFLLTVSPVPLTASASGDHVLLATSHSKSVLRAAASKMLADYDFIDYFPSYEIIASAPFRGMFYEPNMRSVAPSGVQFVMQSFFSCLWNKYGEPLAGAEVPSIEEGQTREVNRARKRAKQGKRQSQDEGNAVKSNAVVCEEEMLAAFAPGSK